MNALRILKYRYLHALAATYQSIIEKKFTPTAAF